VVVVDDDVSEEFCDGCGVVSILTVGVVSDCFCVVWVFPGLETGGAGVDTPGEEGWELGGGGGGGGLGLLLTQTGTGTLITSNSDMGTLIKVTVTVRGPRLRSARASESGSLRVGDSQLSSRVALL